MGSLLFKKKAYKFSPTPCRMELDEIKSLILVKEKSRVRESVSERELGAAILVSTMMAPPGKGQGERESSQKRITMLQEARQLCTSVCR